MRAPRVVVRPGARDRAPAPGAAQVQPVEVRDLAVGAVADLAGSNSVAGSRPRCAAGSASSHAREVRSRQHAPHALGLDQRRRQKIVAARLPRLAVRVVAVPRHAPSRAAACRSSSSCTVVGVLERERERERGVEVRADANRIRRLGQELGEARRRRRRRAARARAHDAVVPWRASSAASISSHAQPYGRSKPPRIGCVEILPARRRRSSAVSCASNSSRSPRASAMLGKRRQQRGEQPVAVHARVPVEAAEEDRMQLARRAEVRRPVAARDRACSGTRASRARARAARRSDASSGVSVMHGHQCR